MKQMKIIMLFITNEHMTEKPNHVDGFASLKARLGNIDLDTPIVIHVKAPVSNIDVIYELNAFARDLISNGTIAGHGMVLPFICTASDYSTSKTVFTAENKYRKGCFIMEVW